MTSLNPMKKKAVGYTSGLVITGEITLAHKHQKGALLPSAVVSLI